MKACYVVVVLACLLGSSLQEQVEKEQVKKEQVEKEEVEKEKDYPGQMQPLGVGVNAEHVEIRTDLPDPIEFHDKYVNPSVPVLLKGVAKSFPGYEKLRNDSYLK